MGNTGRKTTHAAPGDGGAAIPLGKALGSGPGGEKRWRELLQLDDAMFEQCKIRLLTPEARVLLHLRLEGSVPVTSALPMAGTSYRGFYAVIERLKKAGLVATVKDSDDQRVRRLSLETPSTPAKS